MLSILKGAQPAQHPPPDTAGSWLSWPESTMSRAVRRSSWQGHGLSRFQIARLLQEAVDSGVVTISIEADATDEDGMAEQLAAALGLSRAIVVEDDNENRRRSANGSGCTLLR